MTTLTDNSTTISPLACASFIREIGRGAKGARSLSREDAHTLFAAILQGAVSDMELGAILLAMRIKGESVDELAGFADAMHESIERLSLNHAKQAVVIPSYNGARNLPNLTPLLVRLLAQEGVPVLVHGVLNDPGRVSTCEVMTAMGMPPCRSIQEAVENLNRGEPAFLPIQILAPRMAYLLSIRRTLGVRNSGHMLVKIMQPFTHQALRLVNYTHPEYLKSLTQYFLEHDGHALLSRGTEGEAVASARRAAQIDWFHDGQVEMLIDAQAGVLTDMPALPTQIDAVSTAVWIQAVLGGERPVPAPIEAQVNCILDVLQRSQGNEASNVKAA